MMHLSGVPRGVSQMVRKGSFRRLYQIRRGRLRRNADSHASDHEIGIESSHPSH